MLSVQTITNASVKNLVVNLDSVDYIAKTNTTNDLFESISSKSYSDILKELKDPSLYIKEDKPIQCRATTKNKFANNRILVALTIEASLSMKDYTVKDFSEIGAISVELITKFDSNNLKNDYEEKVQEFKDCLDENSLQVAKESNSISTIEKAKSELYAKKSVVSDYYNFHKIYAIYFSPKDKEEIIDTVHKLEEREDIYVAEPDYANKICSVPNDTHFNKQWALQNTNLPSAWNITTGSKDVLVGIIDTGIDYSHPDLKANINTSLSKSYVDSSPLVDETGHGTAVAGVIGAVGNNSSGISGACWNVSMVSFKNSKSDTSEVYDYYYSQTIETAMNNNIEILNLSGSLKGDILSTQLKRYNGIFVTSAGNDNLNIDTYNGDDFNLYPQILTNDNMIVVAAIDKNNELAVYNIFDDRASNYGKYSVDLAAPGEDIYTTTNNSSKRYDYMDGTSFAAPYVTGVAALIKSKYPTISYHGIKEAILGNVDKDDTLGAVKTSGKLNAAKAINSVPEHTFTIKYNKNGGTGTAMSNSTVTYGIPKMLRANTYTFTGRTFTGWNAQRSSDSKWLYKAIEDGKEGWYVKGKQPSGYVKALYKDRTYVAHTSKTIGDTITMYAQWRANKYTINFEKNGGTGTKMPNQIFEYGTYQNLSANTYTKTGYHFVGWTAYRLSDNTHLFTNGTTNKWCVIGSQPTGYTLCKYKDKASVGKTSSVDGDVVYLYASWEAN